MSNLYRIKPLELEVNGHVQIANTPMYEFRIIDQLLTVTFSIRPGVPSMERVACSSVEEAKDTCRRWWEANSTQFLEPAYQPSTELPTEPGLYWFRKDEFRSWDHIEVFMVEVMQGKGKELAVNYYNGRDYPPKGQWLRIPEPEEEK